MGILKDLADVGREVVNIVTDKGKPPRKMTYEEQLKSAQDEHSEKTRRAYEEGRLP